MPKLHLTKSVIDELQPLSSDVVYWDDSLPSFGLKITPTGRKVFIVLYRTKAASTGSASIPLAPMAR